MLLPSGFLSVLQFPISPTIRDACTSLTSITSIPNTRITEAARYPAGTIITTNADITCFTPHQQNSVDMCRVHGVITTSPTSAVDFEMWLPDTWYGRFLVTGNGGLGGCVDYANLDHGSYLHFATIGTNNGHDGNFNAPAFLMPSKNESVTNFSHRSIHVAAQVGKNITSIYYGSDPHHSYYDGCSAGGRQGISAAYHYPDDFDGVIAGAPGIDWNDLLGASAIWASHVAFNSCSFIPIHVWETVVTPEILKQCDGLDGRVDGMISNPDTCQFNPTTLLCTEEDAEDPSKCLIQAQVDGLRKFYEPIYDSHRNLLFSRFDPGAEGDLSYRFGMSGVMSPLTEIWYKMAVYGDPTRSLANFSVADIEYADSVDPVGVSTWENALQGLAEFKRKGGKLLTYHGTRDPMIPSGQSKRFYQLLASSLSPPGRRTAEEMDSFYRLFIVPGMGHCYGGPGAWKFAQGAILGRGTDGINQTDHSVMLSIVDWVENGNPPGVIIGTDEKNVVRKHCMWPSSKTVWDGKEWVCQPV
ncbi:tannase and feruloyl esterase [Thelephora ganbajun]|uniref:Tannase and feruloyl esterase n=1 Tax=Thelephora ganbajun TaxID=370292 RepID=A0ACB6ZHP5_THEGA|nr:tannase and feruloyl esterase [Thelephora ganbajun]